MIGMDHEILQFIKRELDEVKYNLKEVDHKVDSIIEWKWKIVGGVIAVSSILTIAFQIGIKVLGH